MTEEGYYSVRQIKQAMAETYDEDQKWLSTKWLGRALKCLGFTEKLSGAKKKLRKKILEKARQALTEKRGHKIPTVGIFRKISEDCIT